MEPTFKKGQKVSLLVNWNDIGSIRIRDCIVFSCGKKRMVLTDAATGEEVGREFLPRVDQYNHSKVLPVQVGFDVTAKAGMLSAQIRADKLAHYERCLSLPDSSKGYLAAIEKDKQKLLAHVPTIEPWGVK